MTQAVIEHSGSIWIAEEVLTQVCAITTEYLKNRARPIYRSTIKGKLTNPTPDTGAAWRYARFGNTFYYDYSRISDRAPTYYRSQINLAELLKDQDPQDIHNQLIETIRKALDYDYKDFVHNYIDCNNRDQLARGAACLAKLAQLYKDTQDHHLFIEQAIDACRRMSVPYLPSGSRRFRERIEAYMKGESVTSLVFLPRAGNQNAQRVTDPDIISWMVRLRAMPQNWTHAHIIRIIQRMCDMYGKTCPSASWFYNQLCDSRIKFLTSTRWEGKGRHGNPHTGYTPIADPLFAGDVWQIDGTRVNLIDHTGPDGLKQFLYVIALRDGYSGDILGVHFDTKEDRYGYYNVLKMAVSQVGYLPYELVIDRFPGHNTQEWQTLESRLKLHGTKVTYTSKATGKAQVERWFGTLQTVFMQGSKYYYGEGVRSSRAFAHRTAEHLARMRKEARRDGWDFDTAWQEGMRVIDAYRNTQYSEYSRKRASLHASPRELHNESEKPNTHTVQPWQFADLFGMEKRVAVRRHGLLKIEILRVQYHFRITDPVVIENHESVTLAYEMDDLSQVWLFSADERRDYLGIATEQRAVRVHGPDADMSALGESKAAVANIERHRADTIQELISAGDNEVDLLMEGLLSKGSKESSETSWLLERTRDWQDHGTPRLPVKSQDFDDDDDSPVTADVRDLY